MPIRPSKLRARRESRQAARARFDRLVEAALASLPPRFQPYLEGVAILVEDWPDPDDLDALGVPPDETIFGLQRGPTLAEQGLVPFPPTIVIYRGPIEEACETDAEIQREVRTTVLHEVGHYFGMSEADLDRLGLA